MREAIHRTPMRGGMRANACISFGVSPDALMDLWMRRLNEHGVRSYWIYDVLYGIENFARLARVAKEYGSQVVGTVFYTISPVHTDEYLAAKAAEIAAVPEIDGVLFYDTAGVLEVERLRELLPKIVAAAAPKPVEIHANNLMGTSGLTYVEAVKHGVKVLHTAARSMSNGPSVPSTESVVRNLELMGWEHCARHLAAGAGRRALPRRRQGRRAPGRPGQRVRPLQRHPPDPGRDGRDAESPARAARDDPPPRRGPGRDRDGARGSSGWPVMATPLSQLVGTQAVLNVVTGDRYELVPDQVVAYAAGHYGEPPAPIDAEVLERIMSADNAARVVANPPEQPTLEELRARHGTGPGEDDLLILRALIPEHDIAAMQAAGPVAARLPAPLARGRRAPQLDPTPSSPPTYASPPSAGRSN